MISRYREASIEPEVIIQLSTSINIAGSDANWLLWFVLVDGNPGWTSSTTQPACQVSFYTTEYYMLDIYPPIDIYSEYIQYTAFIRSIMIYDMRYGVMDRTTVYFIV